MKTKPRINPWEFKLLLDWADTAPSNDESWRRILTAAAVYPELQLSFNEFVATFRRTDD